MSAAGRPRWWASVRALLLGLFDPAGAYFERNSPYPSGPVYRGGAVFGPDMPGGSRQASEAELLEMRGLGTNRREHAADVRRRYGALADAAAQTLARTGHAVVSTPTGRLDAQVVRFWHGDSILEIRRHSATGSTGRSASRLDRHRDNDVPALTEYLARSLTNLEPR